MADDMQTSNITKWYLKEGRDNKGEVFTKWLH